MLERLCFLVGCSVLDDGAEMVLASGSHSAVLELGQVTFSYLVLSRRPRSNFDDKALPCLHILPNRQSDEHPTDPEQKIFQLSHFTQLLDKPRG
jgi:hypothetical protein